MVTLTMDEKRDLSSRASGWMPGSDQVPLEKFSMASADNFWDGSIAQTANPIRLTFDQTIWLVADSQKALFSARGSGSSVQIFYKADPLPKLSVLLPPEFAKVKGLIEVPGVVPGWKVASGEYMFLGQPRIVEVWSRSDGVVILLVMTGTDSRAEVTDFLNGLTVGSSLVKGAMASETDSFAKLATLSRPSVVRILTKSCNSVNFVTDPGLYNLSGKSYPYCSYSQGSGFFISPDGYIGTNGHVVSNFPEDGLYFAILSGDAKDLAIDVMSLALKLETGVDPDRARVTAGVDELYKSKMGVLQLYTVYQSLFKKQIFSFGTEKDNYWVQLGNKSIEASVNTKERKIDVSREVPTAKLVDKDFGRMDETKGFSGSDVAILKIDEAGPFPALPLADPKDVVVGSSIQIIGFPGVGSGSDEMSVVDVSSTVESTVTKGIVSALKEAKGDKKRLIQTDATINHGNSGGPAFDEKGRVIGLATYGLTPESGGGNFNFLRDIGDLKVLMEKNNIKPTTGPVYDNWKSGLESYWLSYFKWANDDLSKVLAEYPIHPLAAKYVQDAKTLIGKPEDKTPVFTRTQRRLYLSISGGVMALSLLAALSLSIWDFTESRKKKHGGSQPPMVSAPVIPVSTF